jgi:Tfp pilus assembly protein PilP
MAKAKKKTILQKNKNNKTKPENLMKKEYLESYEKLKKSIIDDHNS